MLKRRPRSSSIVLVLGGAASGKSQRALDLAGRTGPKAFVATGEALDAEMAERIAAHRASRHSSWHTAEVPCELAAWFAREAKQYRVIVVDCLTLWLSNLTRGRVANSEVPAKVAELMTAIRRSGSRVIVVSNELGLGLVPVGPTVRRFRDLAGKVNQLVAAHADEVHLVVAGQSVRVK